jgi:predicted Zn-dependent protease
MKIGTMAFSLGLMALVAGGCTTNPATGRSQLDLISTEEEIALGAQAAPEMVKEYGGEVQSEPLKSYVRGVGARIAALTEADYPDLPWEFFVLDSDVINAFAIPGGKVFVSRGLLSYMQNEAQLAAVLGHEIGHVVAQHVDERLSRSMAAQLGMEVIGGMSDSQIVNAGAALLTQGTLLKFDRNQESESDRLGLKYMVAAGYDPEGMVEMLQILVDTSGGSSPPEFFSTHPDPLGRRESIADLIREDYGFAVNNPDYGSFQQNWQQSAVPYLPPAGGEGDARNARSASDRRRERRGN